MTICVQFLMRDKSLVCLDWPGLDVDHVMEVIGCQLENAHGPTTIGGVVTVDPDEVIFLSCFMVLL